MDGFEQNLETSIAGEESKVRIGGEVRGIHLELSVSVERFEQVERFVETAVKA